MKYDKALRTVIFWITTVCSPIGGNIIATKFGAVKYEYSSSRQHDITEGNFFFFLSSTDTKIRTPDRPCRYYVRIMKASQELPTYITLTVLGLSKRARFSEFLNHFMKFNLACSKRHHSVG